MNVNQPHPTPEELFAYRDGELKSDRRVVVEAHVLSCHACREAIDEVSRLESELRLRADEPGEAYLERMTDQVMGRILSSDAAPRAERRRSEAELEWEAKRARAPRFPWVALISTASAATTVLIVAVLLIRQGAVLKHPPQISVLERSSPDAARSRGARDSLGAGAPEAGAVGKKRANRELAAKDGAVRGDATHYRGGVANEVIGGQTAGGDKQEGNNTVAEEKLARLQKEADERSMKSVAERDENVAGKYQAPPPSAVGKVAAPSTTMDDKAKGSAGELVDPRFAALLQKYGLPPTWGPGISDDNVLRAEPALRNLYRTGGIASPVDSARARLYFAEAMRVQAGAAPDSATVDEIIHHYQRAIRLSAGDADTRRIAAQRLQEFLQERSTQP